MFSLFILVCVQAVQWCYATPTDVLAAVDMPAVTNFRVSFDFCYGNSWHIGLSSMLVWTLGAHPSKDTLWTTANNFTVNHRKACFAFVVVVVV